MDIKERLEKAKEAGENYRTLAQMFEAALTEDLEYLQSAISSGLNAVRFAALTNSLTEISSDLISDEPLAKFAAVFNKNTTAEILERIGLDNSNPNPVIPEAILEHPNVTQELKAFWAITEIGILDLYDDESERYFLEAVFDGKNFRRSVDLLALEALLYLHILGFIPAPDPVNDFWNFFYDGDPENATEIIEMYAQLPAIPYNMYDDIGAVNGARCLAAAETEEISVMKSLLWDDTNLWSGIGGFNWQDSRSPRSSVASNLNAPPDLLRQLFVEETQNPSTFDAFPQTVLWRLAANEYTPVDVLEGIVALIEADRFDFVFTVRELLCGEESDYPFGLVTNTSVTGELRERVERLIRQVEEKLAK